MGNFSTTIKDWVEERPYLNEIARLQKLIAPIIEGNIKEEQCDTGIDTEWEYMVDEVKKGIPVLKATEINSTLIENAVNILINIVNALAAGGLPEKMIKYCRQTQTIFHEQKDLAGRLVAEVIESNNIRHYSASLDGISEGFIVFLAWSALAGALEPLKKEVTGLLEDYQWMKGYCPVCGHLPAMGRLVRTKKGRERELVCGCCQMKWRYMRIGCPYCGNDEQDTLKIIGLIEEPDLRIDTCEKCKCYLKTYTGEGKEQVALADWSTLHLDLIAEKHGFKRIGYRRYEV